MICTSELLILIVCSSLALLCAYFIIVISACTLTPFTNVLTTTKVLLPEPSGKVSVLLSCWLSLPTEIASGGAQGAWTHAAGANQKTLLPKATKRFLSLSICWTLPTLPTV